MDISIKFLFGCLVFCIEKTICLNIKFNDQIGKNNVDLQLNRITDNKKQYKK